MTAIAPPKPPVAGTEIPAEPKRPQSHAEHLRTVQRIVVLGGGFGGLYTVRRLEKLFRHHEGVQVTLVSRDNYFLMTPFLFEAGSGVLEPRHAVNPVRGKDEQPFRP